MKIVVKIMLLVVILTSTAFAGDITISQKINFFSNFNSLVEKAKGEIASNFSGKIAKIAENIPNSLILSITALESRYGTSRLAKTHANFGGQKASRRGGNEYKKFKDPLDSIRSMLVNLSTNKAYKPIQDKIEKGVDNPKILAPFLTGIYCEKKANPNYDKDLIKIIKINNLTQYDDNHPSWEKESNTKIEKKIKQKEITDKICEENIEILTKKEKNTLYDIFQDEFIQYNEIPLWCGIFFFI